MRSASSQHAQSEPTEPLLRRRKWRIQSWDQLCRYFLSPSEPTRLWPAIAGALVIAMVCLVVPTAAPDLGVDASWSAVLNWAHARGLQFGKEVVFTYGPLGYLLAPYFLVSPQTSTILFSAALSFQVGLGLCLVGGRLGLLWRFALLGFFLLESANAERKADLMLQVGLLCWGLLCVIESGRRQRVCAAGFILLAGVSGLTKVNYLFVGCFSACALSAYCLIRGERKLGLVLLPGFVGLVLLAWMGSGQHLSNFPRFVRGAYLLSHGYDQAATLEGLPMLRRGGILIGLLALMTILLHTLTAFDSTTRRVWWKRTVLLGWLAGLLLAVWKHSMVRMERLHFFDLAVFGPVAGMVLATLPGPARLSRKIAGGLTAACCLLSLAVVESAFLPSTLHSCLQVVSEANLHLRWLFNPAVCGRHSEPELEARRREAQLPLISQVVGKGSLDVFGFHQAHALLNGLNYHPRPVFQSYLAYNRELSHLNQQFYLSAEAPDYVLFELAGLEHRFAALDDAMALPIFLANYKPVTNESGFLLLKRQSESRQRARLVEQGAVSLGAKLDVSGYLGTNLWLELEVSPAFWGKIEKLFYKSPPLRLSVWETNSLLGRPSARRQAAPSVMESGFLCSPFFTETRQVMDFYANRPVLRPEAFSVEPAASTEGNWQGAIHFRLYQFE